jgi:hypothetical protein
MNDPNCAIDDKHSEDNNKLKKKVRRKIHNSCNQMRKTRKHYVYHFVVFFEIGIRAGLATIYNRRGGDIFLHQRSLFVTDFFHVWLNSNRKNSNVLCTTKNTQKHKKQCKMGKSMCGKKKNEAGWSTARSQLSLHVTLSITTSICSCCRTNQLSGLREK